MKQFRAILSLSIILLLILLTSLAATAQNCEEDKTVRAKALLAGFFPELKEHALEVSVHDGLQFRYPQGFTSFSMVLEPMPIDANPNALKGSGLPLISHFTFRIDGLLEAWSFDPETTDVHMRGTFGNFNYPPRLRAAIAEVNAHREWSETDIAAALVRAGAKTPPGPNRESIQGIDVAGLKPIFPNFRLVSAEFYYRDDNEYREGRPSALLWWRIVFSTHLRNREVQYVGSVDPFTGRPFSIELSTHIE